MLFFSILLNNAENAKTQSAQRKFSFFLCALCVLANSALNYQTSLLRNVLNKTHHVAGIAVFIVIPGHDLDEGIIQRDTGLGIEDG